MRIPLHDILHAPQQKLAVQTVLDLTHLCEEVDQLVHVDPVPVAVELWRAGDVYQLQGEGSTDVRLRCSRCLTTFERSVQFPLQETLVERELTEEEEEADVIRIEDRQVDLFPLVESAFILTLPYAPICRDECRGLCPRCGTDRNERECSCDTTTIDPRWSKLQDLLNHLRN